MGKITYMLQIYDKAAMRLNKATFRKSFKPVLHAVNRLIISFYSMNDNFSFLGFYKNNVIHRKRLYFSFGFQSNTFGNRMV